jgi:fucose 4-O-acetylase-like acetyltransferase
MRTINPKRDESIDRLKGLLICLVVLGHAFGLTLKFGLYKDLYQLIYLFHMPAFLFVTGYLSSAEKTVVQHLKSIGYIYLVCQCFYFLSDLLLYQKASLLRFMVLPNYALWYLLVTLYCKIILTFFHRSKRIIPIIVLLARNCFSERRLTTYMPTRCKGCYTHKF